MYCVCCICVVLSFCVLKFKSLDQFFFVRNKNNLQEIIFLFIHITLLSNYFPTSLIVICLSVNWFLYVNFMIANANRSI